jgi:cobalt/nickel transport system permease protein
VLLTGAIAAPAVFLTPGEPIYRLPGLGWTMTSQGLTSAALLLARAVTAVSLTLLLVLSTPWGNTLKALRVLGTPAVVIVILGMTKRYIFLLIETAHELFEARRSRSVGRMGGADARRFASASLGALLERSLLLSNEIHLAMLSRGFRGRVDTLDEFRMRSRDWIALMIFLLVSATAIWRGR